MKRVFAVLLALAVVSIGVTTRADVKTQQRTKATFEGMLGKMVGMFGGKAAKDGIVSTVAVRGDRMMTVTDTTGQIIDLAEEKIYDLDMKKKTYKVTTFEELRRQMEEARKKAEKEMKEEREEPEEPEQREAPEMEVDFDVKATGQTKTIAGHATREVVVTITTREKGKTLEEGGGIVLTTSSWMATDVPELQEVQDFHARYAQKLGDVMAGGASAEQMAAAMAMYPGMKAALDRMQQENVKVEGTPLATTMVMEGVKSADQMAQAQPESGGGGLGGMLARKMMKKKDESPRSKVMTTETETLSIATSVADPDVSIPAGFKEKT